MELQDIDLNLLVVFDALLHQRRVSAVAVTLGISQPAVSNALNRLRRTLKDDLFLRTAQGMIPTALAQTLAAPIAGALKGIHGALSVPARFDPASDGRTFTVAMADIGEIYFLPGLIRKLAQIAPGVTINTVWDRSENLRSPMEQGHVDLALGFLPDLKTGFFQRRLFQQKYVCLFRKEHPAARAGMTMKTFREAEHLSIIAQGTGHSMVDAAIGRAGVRRDIRLFVPHFVAVGHILQTTDLVAVVPEAYAVKTLAPFGLVSTPCPVRIPAITVTMLWHARNHREPANQWLRQLIFDGFVN